MFCKLFSLLTLFFYWFFWFLGGNLASVSSISLLCISSLFFKGTLKHKMFRQLKKFWIFLAYISKKADHQLRVREKIFFSYNNLILALFFIIFYLYLISFSSFGNLKSTCENFFQLDEYLYLIYFKHEHCV